MSELDFPEDTPKPSLASTVNPAGARLFTHARHLAEREIVSAYISDHTGECRTLCAGLTPEIFNDKQAKDLFRVMSRGVNGYSWEQVAEKAHLTKDQYRAIEKLDANGDRLGVNLKTVRGVFSKTKRAALKTAVEAEELDPKLVIAEAQALDRATGTQHAAILAEITARAFRSDEILSEPAAIYSINNVTICTAGNLTTIKSEAKGGKSAITAAMISAAHTNPTSGHDCLRITGPNYAKHAVLHFDTEQGRFHWHRSIRYAMKRVGRESPESWFRSFTLSGLDALLCRSLIETAMTQAFEDFGGIHSVIIDGTADLVVDPNDPLECFPLVTKLLNLAGKYSTAIINVVHTNPRPAGKVLDDAKARGHLGSQIERKSESNLILEKDADGTTIVYAPKQRGQMIPKHKATAFRWSDEKMMHVTVQREAPAEKGRGRPLEYDFVRFRQVFPREQAKAINGAVAVKMCMELDPDMARATAYRLLTQWSEAGTLVREAVGVSMKYHLNVP